MKDKSSAIRIAIGLISILIGCIFITLDINELYQESMNTSSLEQSYFLMINMYFVSWVVYILLLKAGILILLKSGSAQFLYITLGFIVLMEAILNCTVYKVRILNDFSLVILVIIAMSSLIFCYFNELSRPYIKFKKVNNKETFIMLLISGIIVYLPTATLSIIFK